MRVLLIDDHALFRSGLETLLERRGITVCGATGDGEEGLVLAGELAPDAILLDLRLPGTTGIELLSRMRQAGITTPVVMLTTSDEERDLVASLRSGAQGYLLKDTEPDALVTSLHEILQGKTVVAPNLAGLLARVIQGGDEAEIEPPVSDPFAELTPRELEILAHLAEGQSNKVIARHLDITDGTVKLHVKAILHKLGIHSRVEAAVLAVEHGLPQRREG